MSTQLDDKTKQWIEEMAKPYLLYGCGGAVGEALTTLATELQAEHAAALQAKDTEIARLREAIQEAVSLIVKECSMLARCTLTDALSPNPEAKA